METRNTERVAVAKANHPILFCLICASLIVPGISIGSTSVDLCQEPIEESRLSIAYYNNEKSAFDRNPGKTNRENFSTDLLYKANDNWILGFGHRTTVLNVDDLELQTNGYLHTFFFPIHRIIHSDGTSIRFGIAPALSASSNVTSDPGEYRPAALQLLAALVWDRPISDRLGLRYGVCADHRFGDYEIYPLVGVNWQPHPDWNIEFGFPTSQVSHRVSENLSAVLRVEPNGNEWYVKDKSLERHSQLVYDAYLLEWEVNWRAHSHFMLAVSVGREFHSRYRMTLLNENRIRLSSDPSTRIGVALAWIF